MEMMLCAWRLLGNVPSLPVQEKQELLRTSPKKRPFHTADCCTARFTFSLSLALRWIVRGGVPCFAWGYRREGAHGSLVSTFV